MDKKRARKLVAMLLFLAGLLQAGSFIIHENLIFALAGIAYALTGVFFWLDI